MQYDTFSVPIICHCLKFRESNLFIFNRKFEHRIFNFLRNKIYIFGNYIKRHMKKLQIIFLLTFEIQISSHKFGMTRVVVLRSWV